MAKCWRHFTALSKKNAIVWYRTPLCAIVEILTPALLMIILCVLRAEIPLTTTDAKGMLKKTLPVFPGVAYYENGYWYNSTDGDHVYDIQNRPMMEWVNYTYGGSDPSKYSMGIDKFGPQFFFPSHCLKTFDY